MVVLSPGTRLKPLSLGLYTAQPLPGLTLAAAYPHPHGFSLPSREGPGIGFREGPGIGFIFGKDGGNL
jgi:hypothetical protein